MTRSHHTIRRACAAGLVAAVPGTGLLLTPVAAYAMADGTPTVHSVNDEATLVAAINLGK
ncbi:hypothetical protein ACTU6U_11500 [Microbacterium sp. A196]|uniref:hypothetical protein n=1 Tax=unclassified Microbacterium TaxID=2609290 RepID=UPI003FD00488